jgi:phosphoglycolate phosphatase-like HAD superfamily hydrolase
MTVSASSVRFFRSIGWALLVLLAACAHTATQTDPLASWNDGPAKQSIVAFVKSTTEPGSPGFVPAEERVATFDQDGTLWVEHPLYTEIMFTLSRVAELAPGHPEWKDKYPFNAVIAGDRAAMAKFSEKDLLQLVAATHTGVSVTEFTAAAKAWMAKARHPRWNRPYSELTFAPMQELVRYLKASGYRTYIVSGGTQPFMRAFTQEVYGIPPEQIIGTAFATRFTPSGDTNSLMVEPKALLDNNYGGKAENINLFIGRRPQAAFGNSAGDAEMLAYSQGGAGTTLQMLVLHDDAQREYAYGPAQGLPNTSIGSFSQALHDEAVRRGWKVISIKKDWKRVFAWEQ